MPSQSTARVVAAARAEGLEVEIVEFPEGTKTADQAARAVGCPVAAIVKSLVFTVDDEPVVVLVPGDRRLDAAFLAAVAGARRASRAPLDVVRQATGFAAGGTPPFGHERPVRVFADEALRRHERVWAAGGTPNTVFEISIDDIDRLARPTWGVLSRSVDQPPGAPPTSR